MSKLIFYLLEGRIRYPSPPPGQNNTLQLRKTEILAIIRARNKGWPQIRDGSQIEAVHPRGKPKETIYTRGALRGTPAGDIKSRGDPRGDPAGETRAGTPPDIKMVT